MSAYVLNINEKRDVDMSKVWLITGSSRGLGRNIAETVLASGDLLVATARDTHALADLVARYGAKVRPVRLDVTDADGARAAVQVALDAFGKLDVVVNNAGYGHVEAFEHAGEAAFRAQIETNFFGVVHMTRAALPAMRHQRSGRIIQISSVGARVGTPGLAAYQAAKWAVGGFTEVVNAEVAHLGIKVTALEPGGMATGWASEAAGLDTDVIEDYADSVGALMDMIKQYVGKETGDPAKVAEVVMRLACHDHPPVRLLLGTDAVQFAADAEAARAASDKLWRAVSVSTDFGAACPIPAFPG